MELCILVPTFNLPKSRWTILSVLRASLRVTLDRTCELIFCLSCSLSYKNFPVTSILECLCVNCWSLWVWLSRLNFWCCTTEKEDDRWTFAFAGSPTQLASIIFLTRRNKLLLFYSLCSKMTEFDQAGKLRDFLGNAPDLR